MIGEGAGVLLIKRYDDAVRDRDHVHAIVKGTSITHSGRTFQFGAPSGEARAKSLRHAFAAADVAASSISYVETAVSGTSIADAAEVSALRAVLGPDREADSPCYIGSLKGSVGHLESASALSQITKVLLQMKHRMLAPTANCKPLNPLIQLDDSGFVLVDGATPWPNDGGDRHPRRALVNVFGATGTAGHVVLEAPVDVPAARDPEEHTPVCVPLSAATPQQLTEVAARLRAFLGTAIGARTELGNIAFTLSVGRVPMRERVAFVASGVEELVEKLTAFIDGAKNGDYCRGVAKSDATATLVASGQDVRLAAAAWVDGRFSAWESVVPRTARRVSLPCYPFARTRHWVNLAPSLEASGERSSSAARLERSAREKTEEYLLRVFSELSEIPRANIDPAASLELYGINSSIIQQFNGRLEERYGALSKTLLFEHRTLRELAEYLAEQNTATASPKRSGKGNGSAKLTNGAAAIAVIGVSGRYPQAATLAEFWKNMRDGRDCIVPIPKDRWNCDSSANVKGRRLDEIGKWGGFLDGVAEFDALFFSISPMEARHIDPQERLYLQIAHEVLEDAGYDRESIRRYSKGRVGVFVGVMYGEYQLLDGTSCYGSIANRVSYFFDFHGPSMAVDTMCSASLTAIHLAVQSIRQNECEYAIAGGVNLSLHPAKYAMQSQLMMLSSDGRCRSFGDGGDGMVPGEGVGAVLLKPLNRAVEDGDAIWGVIRATAINHGGKTNGYTVPNPAAQREVIFGALEAAGMDPRTISYIEAHGTGTSLGDPIEIAGLSQAFERATQDKQFCAIGSVKSNIGHLESAAGIAGVTKVLLQLKHGMLAPSLHARALNPNIDFERTPFRVQQKLDEWPRPVLEMGGELREYPRRAGISSFGAGGANAHVIIEEYVEPEELRTCSMAFTSDHPALIVLSAKSADQLKQQVKRLHDHVKGHAYGPSDLGSIAYTLQVGREAMEHRLAFTAATMEEMEEKLRAYVEGKYDRGETSECYRGQAKKSKETLAALIGDAEFSEMLEKWVQRGKYTKVLELWVKGLSVDWGALYAEGASYGAGGRPRRRSLPTYPFARERYWIESGEVTSVARAEGQVEERAAGRAEVLLLSRKWTAKEPDERNAREREIERWVLVDPSYGDCLSGLASRQPNVKWELLAGEGDEESALGARVVAAGQQLLERVQAILQRKPVDGAMLQVVLSRNASEAGMWCLSGLLRSAHQENSKFVGQVIEVPAGCESGELSKVVEENSRENARKDFEVRYRDGVREILRYGEVDVDVAGSEAAPPYKPGGVYLITGGAGGLGRIFAREIAEQVADARIILAGRSELASEVVEEIRTSAHNGAIVEYRVMDVADAERTRESIDEIVRRYGRLNGIIHGAGVIHDEFLMTKSLGTFLEVLKPKVMGTIHLDRASAELELDFFVVFSSMVGIYGNVGQGDYALANAFLDTYARRRDDLMKQGKRRGRTLSVNWPLWAAGGMSVDAGTWAGMARRGLHPLTTEAGIRAWYRAWETTLSQVAVAYGARDRLREYVPMMRGSSVREKAVARPIRAAAGGGTQLDTSEIRERTLLRLKTVFSEVSGLAVDRIDEEVSLENYGIDSVMIVKLNEKLEVAFDALTNVLFYEFSTLGELNEYLVAHRRDECVRWSHLRPAESHRLVRERASGESKDEREVRHVGSRSRESSEGTKREGIAIIGLSGRYPGSSNVDEFWGHLRNGRDCVREVPSERWPLSGFYEADPERAVAKRMSYSKWGGFIEGFADFDPLFFGISPREATIIDPQERLFLQTCWEVLEDAGYSKERLAELHGGRVGVYAGITKTGYELHGPKLRQQGEVLVPLTSFGSLANRVSYVLDLHGPSMPIDTMCSASLTAIHEACEHLLRDECELAIAGGVNLYLHPSSYVLLCAGGMLSPDGQCRSFGANANGFVPGEGVGAVLLKPLQRAVEDGDHIYGVIKGTSVNHGGKTNGYMVPNPVAQGDLVSMALKKAGVDPRAVSYIEAHGTGTSLGDPIEIAGLTRAFEQHTQDRQFCAIGSVKGNIGHLESAAGIAGVTRVLLQLKHGMLTPSLHSKSLNPFVDFERTPFRVQQEPDEWRRPVLEKEGVRREYPRIAGVSSFGAGGANAHVIIEEYMEPENAPVSSTAWSSEHPALIVLSARSEDRLREQAKRLHEHVQRHSYGEDALGSIAYTLQVGREAMEHRLAFTAATMDELRAKLRACVEGKDESGEMAECHRGQVKKHKEILAIFKSDGALQQVMAAWLEQGKYSKLLSLWVSGLALDWDSMYRGTRPRRTPLPTYPFAVNRYWIGDLPSDPSVAAEVPMRSPVVAAEVKRDLHGDERRGSDGKPTGIVLSTIALEEDLVEPHADHEAPVKAALLDAHPNAPEVVLSADTRERDVPNAPSVDGRVMSLDALERELAESLAHVLFLDGQDVDTEAAFIDMGLDSVTGLEWVRILNDRYQLSLNASLLYDFPNVSALAQRLISQSSPRQAESQKAVEVLAAPAPVGGLEAAKRAVAESLAKVLFLDAAEIDPDAAFVDMGLDSVTGVEWVRLLNDRFHISLSAARLYDYPNVAALSEYLSTQESIPREEPQEAVEVFAADAFAGLTSANEPRARVELAPLAEHTDVVREREHVVVNTPTASNGKAAHVVDTPTVSNGKAAHVEHVELERHANGYELHASRESMDGIAIIGMSGAFPKSKDLAEFWENLSRGRDCVSEVPASRWSVAQYYDPNPKVPGKTYSKWGGLLEEIDRFDPLFFNISPIEAEEMDPQQRLFLEHSWRCIEEAGINPLSLSGSRCGVYVGCGQSDYGQRSVDVGATAQRLTGSSSSILSARLSYFLNLKGPCLAIDTACSSSLVAIAEACDNLALHRSDLALAGGVCAMTGPGLHIMASDTGMLSREGRCFTFDARADGFVPGEGVGVVLLKRLRDAIRDEDPIRGVIRGWGVNQNGKTNGMTAPSMASQVLLEKDVYDRFGIHPKTISFVEAHGTGTKLGDPIEVEALTESFRSYTDNEHYCALGSVKSNIGHLLGAAGVAGVIKVLLALQHRMLPPSANYERLNEHIVLDKGPFYINRALEPWEVDAGQSRRAAISSFGFSGTNAHIVIEEFRAPEGGPRPTVVDSNRPALIVLSAKREDRLREQAKQLLTHLRFQSYRGVDLVDIAYTLQVGRPGFDHRLAFLASTMDEFQAKLSAYLDGRTGTDGRDRVHHGRVGGKGDVLPGRTAGQDIATRFDGRFDELAELWVIGLSVDWRALYGGKSSHGAARPKRRSLPTYPFARERYWIASGGGTSVARAEGHVLHPLLHRNTSTFGDQRFSSRLNGEAFYLSGHVVEGQRVLPGVCYLEMARAAIVASVEPSSRRAAKVELRDVVWLQPAVVADAMDIHIALRAPKDGEIAFEIYSVVSNEGEEEVTAHAQGRAALVPAAGESGQIDIVALRGACSETIEVSECYGTFREIGLEYGAALQGLVGVWVGKERGERFVLAQVKLPDEARGTEAEYVLHPSMLDSALQGSIGFYVGRGESGGGKKSPALPFALEALQIHGGSPVSGWVVIRGDGLQKLDVAICDESGRVCVRMKGLSSRGMDGGPRGTSRKIEERGKERVEALLLGREWAVKGVEGTSAGAGETERWVLVDPSYGDCLSGLVSRQPNVKWEVLAGEGDEESALGSRVIAAGQQVLERVQSILQRKPVGEAMLQVVLIRNASEAGLRCLSGLLRTAHQENPKFVAQVIEVPAGCEAGALLKVVEENAGEDARKDREIRYRDGVREVLQYGELDADVAGSDLVPPCKPNGVYLITGGAGGLGQIFAREIAKQAAGARIILTGRKELTTDREEYVRKCAQNGALVEYRVMDVTDTERTRECIDEIVRRHGGLNGIIHSAGVIHDGLLMTKSLGSFLEVVKPKVMGTIHLDRASAKLELDFFVVFSSMVGIHGNVGQGDYALANAFLDTYATYREDLVKQGKRRGRTLSVSWPLWAAGGMGVDEATRGAMERRGLHALTSDDGIGAWYRAWATGSSHVGVVCGVRDRLQEDAPKNERRSSLYGDQAVIFGGNSNELRDKSTRYLKGVLSNALKLPAERIAANEAFDRYGIDSILAVRLVNELEGAFGSLPKTLLFEYQSIETLAGYLIEHHREALTRQLKLNGSETAARPIAAEGATQPSAPAVNGLRTSGRVALQTRRQDTKQVAVEGDLAIIGVSGRYPGANHIEEFWENLRVGKDCITEVPAERWDHTKYFDAEKGKAGKTACRWGGFIDGVDTFDFAFFGKSKEEAEWMDPQERILLEVVWHLMESAGYTSQHIHAHHRGRVGVYVGGHSVVEAGASAAWTAARISEFFKLCGPSFVVDTFSASSLTALHLASGGLANGDCEAAIVAGINVLYPELLVGADPWLTTREDRRGFSTGGGMIFSDGAGAVLIKPLRAAIDDSDRILAIIKSTAIDTTGKLKGQFPSEPAILGTVIRRSLEKARVHPRTIGCIDPCVIGAENADYTEIAAYRNVFREQTADLGFCAMSTVESAIGHAVAASGMAQLAKAILQVNSGQLVPTIKLDPVNPALDLEGGPFWVQRSLTEWSTLHGEAGQQLPETPRRTMFTSRGADGTQAAVVLEQYRANGSVPESAEGVDDRDRLIMVSAQGAEPLRQLAVSLGKYIGEAPSVRLLDLVHTLNLRREPMPYRLAIVARTAEELRSHLLEYAESAAAPPRPSNRVFVGDAHENLAGVRELLDSDAEKALIRRYVEERQLDRIAKYWVLGGDIRGVDVCAAEGGQFLSLPLYPFARTRVSSRNT